MQRRLGSRIVTPVVTVLAVAALATSCGDEQEDAGPAPDSPTSEVAPPTGGPEGDSGSPSPTEPAETTAPADPSVTPATGKLVTTQRLTLRVPRGWQVTQLSNENWTAVDPQAPSERLSIRDGALPAAGTLDLQRLREISIEVGNLPRSIREQEPVEYLGQDWFHQSGALTDLQVMDDFGTYVEGPGGNATFGLTFIQGEYLGAKGRRQVIESVMATIELR